MQLNLSFFKMFNNTTIFKHFQSRDHKMTSLSIRSIASSLWENSLYNQHASVDNLQQTCYHQTGASDANTSGYKLDDCKATSLKQTCATGASLTVQYIIAQRVIYWTQLDINKLIVKYPPHSPHFLGHW